METLMYKNKGDHARALLFEGKSTTEAAEISGLAKGSVDMYFYKLKGKNELSGTPEHPEQTTKSARALKVLQDKRVLKKEKPAKTPKAAEKPKETPPVSPSELANLAGDIVNTLETKVKQEPKVETKPNIEPVTAETMAEMAAGLADTIARQKQKQQDASAPNVKASLDQTMAKNVQAMATPRPMNLQQIERRAKDLTKRPDKIVQRLIRLLRDNCVVSGVARTLEMPEQIVQDVQAMLIANNLMHPSEKRGAPKTQQASQPEALRTAPVPGVPYSKQVIIEKKLMQRISSERISKDLKFSHEYVRKIAMQLIKGNHIKPTLEDVYGESTMKEVRVMIGQGKSALLIANLLQVPIEVVEDLQQYTPVNESEEKEEAKTEAVPPRTEARRLFLEGKNAITIAQQLPLSFEEVVAVFKDLSQEGLIAGTAHAPLSPEALENQKAAPVEPAKEPKFVDEEFADVHGVKHQQIALADETVDEVTFDESIERGLVPEEVEVERVVTLEESVDEGLVPGELEVEPTPAPADDAPNWKQQLGERLKEERLANKAERYDTPALTSQAFLAVAKHEDAQFLKMADAMEAAPDTPFLKDPAEAQREEQLQTELDNIYHGDKDGDHMEQTTIKPEEQQQEDTMLDISLATTTTVALLKEKLDQHAPLTDRQIKELQTETIVEPFDDFVLRVLKMEYVEDFRSAVRRRYKVARDYRNYPTVSEAMEYAKKRLLESNYPTVILAEDYGIPHFDVIDLKEELQPEINQMQETIRKGGATLKLYERYVTPQQFNILLYDTEFAMSINDAKVHPMIAIAVRLMKPAVNLEEYELDNLLDLFRSLSHNALHRGDLAKDVANNLNIPLLFITLFQQVAEDFTLYDIVAEPNGTLHEAVVQTTLAVLERRKSCEQEEKRIQEHQAFGKVAFTGESIASLDFSSNVATVVPEMPEYIGFDYEPVAIPTRLAFGRKAVSVATVRKHIMKMLDMIEMSGNAEVDVDFKISGGFDEERTDV